MLLLPGLAREYHTEVLPSFLLFLSLYKSTSLSAKWPAHYCDQKNVWIVVARLKWGWWKHFQASFLLLKLTCAIVHVQTSCALAGPVLTFPLHLCSYYCNLKTAHVAPWQNYELFLWANYLHYFRCVSKRVIEKWNKPAPEAFFGWRVGVLLLAV